MLDRLGSRSEELDLSTSGPLLSPKAVVRADMPDGRVVPIPKSSQKARRINLLGLDAGRLDDRIPLLDLSPVEGSESGRRQPLRRRHLHAKVGDALVRIWIGHC